MVPAAGDALPWAVQVPLAALLELDGILRTDELRVSCQRFLKQGPVELKLERKGYGDEDMDRHMLIHPLWLLCTKIF